MAASLKSMAADSSNAAVKKTDIYRVDPRLLVEEEGFNLRDYSDPEVIEHIEKFAQSYANGAPVPPLVVRTDDDGQVVVVEGHCRRHGALLALKRGVALAYLDCLPFRGNDAARVEVMLRSAEGLKLKPLAIAMGYQRLINWGHSKSDIANRVNKTSSHVEQMLVLANANSDVHQLVRDGKVSAYAAIDAVREHGERAGAFLASKLHKTGAKPVTRSAVKDWVPPRKIVSSMYGSINSVVATLDRAARRKIAELEKLDPAQLKGSKVEVDAAAFLSLVRAHEAAEGVKAAKAKIQEEAIAKASQKALDMEDQ